MKRTFSYTAALATTAAVGLLAGPAFAQAPITCTTTQTSPAHANCVMPTASAPGGGSFPGSFLVPGTNTSFALHGIIRMDIERHMGPEVGPQAFNVATVPLDSGPGVTNATVAAHAANGGTSYWATARPNFETRTPTAYGSMNTYIEFDFNQTVGTQLPGNNDLVRLRQAYGTLGPWLLGQSNSLFADGAAYADEVAATQSAGMLNTANVRRPQVRYTWLAGNGLSVAGSLEETTYVGRIVDSTGTDTAAAIGTQVQNNNNTGYTNYPSLVVAGEWDQPWGHLKLAAAGSDSQFRAAAGGPGPGINHEIAGGAFTLTGHLNTWGKDALRGGVGYNYAAASFSSDMNQGSAVYNTTLGTVSRTKEWFGYASYEHFFTGQWRANESFGYAHNTGNPFTVACTGGAACPQAGLERTHWTNNVNVVYSPVPQVDLYLEWQHADRKVMSGASGRDDQIDFQSDFYF